MNTDKNILSKDTNKTIYARIFNRILNSQVSAVKKNEDFESSLMKRLGFEKLSGRRLFECCIFTLEETDAAHQDYLDNGFGTRRGEHFLRLYGLLNSVYIQYLIILDLFNLINPNYPKKSIKSKFQILKIIKVRNKIASHPSKYLINNSKKSTYSNLDFLLTDTSTIDYQGELLKIYSGKTNLIETVNLRIGLLQYGIYSDSVLLLIAQKAVNSIFKNPGFKKTELLNMIDILKGRGITTPSD